LVRVPCAGLVDPRSVLAALEKGAGKVLILGCHPDSCRSLQGATRAKRRCDRLRAALAQAGVDATRVEFKGMASVEGDRFVEYVS
jgi:coenzyme F420-reducing hydrogenase delta subunit